MSESKIKLYKTRDFGAKINSTIEYIRYNFLPLVKLVLLVAVPIGLLISIVFKNLFGTIASFSANPEMNEAEALGRMSSLGGNYLLLMLFGMLTYAFLMATVYTYLKMRDSLEKPPDVMDVFRRALPRVPGLLLLMVLVVIVSFAGLLVFVLPGIYLAIALSIAFPIFLFEDVGVGTAFSKAFKLIRGKWWSTFGLLIVTSLMAGVLSYVFAIPMYAVMFGKMFSAASEANPDPAQMMEVFSSWYMTISMSVMMIGSYLTYLVPMIALGFQYFNLSERKEGTGIKAEIADFEKLD